MRTQPLGEVRAKVNQESEVLCRVWSVFPFDFFPDEIVVEKSKVSFIKHFFFGTQEILTVSIHDVQAVNVETSPFFSSIKLLNRTPMIPEISIDNLRTSDAMKLQAVVQGLLIARKEDINVNDLPPDQTLRQVRKLGSPPA